MKDQRPPLTFAQARAATTESPPDPSSEAFSRLIEEFRPWRKLRYVATEIGVDPTEAWRQVKVHRSSFWQGIDVARPEGGSFGVCLVPQTQESLLLIDRGTGVDPVSETQHRTLQKRLLAMHRDGQLLSRGRLQMAMDEAAESSIMEGAATTRRDAVDMLRSGRLPRTQGERMVVNNYLSLQTIKTWLDRPMSIDLLVELQQMLTHGTLDDPTASGRLRYANENVRVVDARTGNVIFEPPHADHLPTLLRSICGFANAEHRGSRFIHPIIKAAIVHFLIGYAHPFVDGNGRTARAAFYWFALRHGYGIFEFLAISEIIRKGFARYPQAYVDSEMDEGDLTYFVLYKLDVIQQSLDRLADHLEQEQERTLRAEKLLRLSDDLNLRQRLLLEHALRHPLTKYTVKSHMNSNGITAVTARTDLDRLVKLRFMTTTKRNKEVLYLLAPGFEAKLQKKLARHRP